MSVVVVDVDDFHFLSGIGGNALNDRMVVGACDNFGLVIRIENALKVVHVLKAVLPPNVKAMRNEFIADSILQTSHPIGLVQILPRVQML